MKVPLIAVLTLSLIVGFPSAGAILRVDFNSEQDGGGNSNTHADPGQSTANHNQSGWSSYHANHEVAAEFSTANYGGITVTPAWPNTTDNRVQQSIDRGNQTVTPVGGNDATWDNTLGYLNLVTDWIGTDTRTGSGGNGNWDGTAGTPTYMTLTIGGLAAGLYQWTSFHHDTENCHGTFRVEISTDGGVTWTQLADGRMTDGTAGGTPASTQTYGGPDPYLLPSTYTTSFTANGTDDVVMRFAPYSDAAGAHRQIWGMNGFEIIDLRVARNPIPDDGEYVGGSDIDIVPGGVAMNLVFTPGDTATSHTAYFSDSFEDVNSRNPDVNLGPPPYPSSHATRYRVGYDEPNIPPFARVPLQRGIPYYWTVVESDSVDTFAGPVWSFTILPLNAWDPTPPDGTEYIKGEPSVPLSWKLGDVNRTGCDVFYDVYYGTDRTAVENRTAAKLGDLTTTSTTIGPLLAHEDYYWRVDTKLKLIAYPHTVTIVDGEIWEFSTVPVVPITDADLVGWWKLDGEYPGIVFDYSGHGNHGTLVGGLQWVAEGKVDGALAFDGVDDIVVVKQNFGLPIYNNGTDNAYSVAMWVKGGPQPDRRVFSEGSTSNNNPLFNLGTQNTGATGRFDVYIRPAGLEHTHSVAEPFDNTWHHIAWVDANGAASVYIDGVLDDTDFSYTRATLALNTTTIGGILRATPGSFFAGEIDDVRAYRRTLSVKEIKILAGCLNAAGPDPAEGATGVARSPVLSWEPGAFAASANGHKVYFSSDMALVTGRDPSALMGTVSDPCYPIVSILDLGTTYYWAIDEVNGPNMWPGDLWRFTTTDHLVVETFETYDATEGNQIFETWIDGAGPCTAPGNNSGSLFDLEYTIVRDGNSAKLLYDNDGSVENPCGEPNPATRTKTSYVEAQVADLPSGIGTNWTIDGVMALSLWFYGDPANTKEPLWVQLNGAGNKVTYGDHSDEDANDGNDGEWHRWLIDLDAFGVTLTNVTSIAIGIGTLDDAIESSGVLYLDDIELYVPQCVVTRRSADFAKFDYVPTCRVDYGELDVMSDQWLAGLEPEPAWAPSSGWDHNDIGDTATRGGFVDNGDGTYSVTGSGADIWGNADAFHFVFKPLVGDGQMTTRVISMTGTSTNVWQKAGVMIRETLDPNSADVMMLMSAGGAGAQGPYGEGDAFQYRAVTGGGGTSSNVVGDTVPVLKPACVRLIRSGDTFRGFVYVNGNWVQEGPTVTIPMADTVYIGLAVTSHDNAAGIYTTATFDNVCDAEFGGPDLVVDGLVNFPDYAALLTRWLEEEEWPQ